MDTTFDALAEIDAAAQKLHQTEQSQKMIADAKQALVMGRDAKAAFVASVSMKLDYEPDWSIDTACTNGRRIRYNPAYVCGLTPAKAVGLLAHEVFHITNLHHVRIGDRDVSLWNVACDLAIDPHLIEAGIDVPNPTVPGKGDFAKIPAGLSAEEIYALLRQPDPPEDQSDQQADGQQGGGDDSGGDGEDDGQNDAGEPDTDDGDEADDGDGDQQPQDPGRSGGVEKPGSGTPAEVAEAEADAMMMAAAAVHACESRGGLPGGLRGGVDAALAPKVDWKAVLREFVSQVARNDYSWTTPNRRFIHAGIYLPGMRSEELGDVVVALDTSGSIDDAMLASFLSETAAILEAFDCNMTIIYHHSDVYRVQQWRSTDGPLVLEPTESGGTSHVPVFDYIAREGLNPAAVVCLTDMASEFPPSDPGVPVLWCKALKYTFPPPTFGRIVQMD